MSDHKSTIDQRLEALTTNLELLFASTHDLRAVVEAAVARGRERDARDLAREERDAKFLGLIADVLKQWAEDRI